jgi:predicted histone-like DNA-binding protein
MIAYKSTPRKNPQNYDLPAKYYAKVVNTEVVDLMRIAKKLTDGSTTREADVYAVLLGLINVMKEELADGRIIRLGDLGDFRIAVKSRGSDNPEDVTANNIISRRVRFLSGKEMKRMLRNLEFYKVVND